MTSSRLILIFLGIIFLMIIILSSNRVIKGLRDRIGSILPVGKTAVQKTTPTPLPTKVMISITPTSTPSPKTGAVSGEQITKGGVKQIPSTGATELAWLVIGGGSLIGLTLRKISRK